MLLIGEIEDQTPTLVWSQISNSLFSITDPILADYSFYQDIFTGLLHPFSTNQPIMWLFISATFSLFGLGFYNILILLTVLLNVTVGYLYFKKFRYGIAYSLLFAFSSFFWVHLGRHLVEMQIWVFPLYLMLLDNKDSVKIRKIVKLSVALVFISLISNYYGYFLFLFTFTYYFSKIIVSLMVKQSFDKNNVFLPLSVCLISGAILVVVLLPQVKSNYFNSSTRSNYVDYNMRRPYEDFFTFSSRPWYFFLPPVKNPYLGDFSSTVIDTLRESGNYLTDDYFFGEHAGNFIGNVLFVATGAMFVFMNKKDYKSKIVVYESVVALFVLCLLTAPPFFTVAGYKFYTPGQLMYTLFPMFRTTARLGILCTLLVITIFASLFSDLFATSSKKAATKRLLSAGFFVIFIVTLLECYSPVKFYYYNFNEPLYSYIANSTLEGSKFAVYPENKTATAFLYLPVHRRLLINPPSYFREDFDSEHFTEQLATPEGIENLVNIDAKYLVVYTNIAEYELDFFKNSSSLDFLSQVGESRIYKVR